jgi:hypothetical protein
MYVSRVLVLTTTLKSATATNFTYMWNYFRVKT